MTTNESQSSRASVVRGLIIAALLLGISVTLKMLSPEYLSPELARRLLGALLGLVVIVYANAVPKALSPLIRMRCDPAAEQAIRRFTGWTLALGGVAYAVAWMIAPLQYANALAGGLLAFAVMVVITRLVLGMARELHA